jgi:hypothetical protein
MRVHEYTAETAVSPEVTADFPEAMDGPLACAAA